MPAKAQLGMVHGRFQPFHLGHLEYATRAAEQCVRLVVGITGADAEQHPDEPGDPARTAPGANPFSFWERLEMVILALEQAGMSDFRVTPFPISHPALWHEYVPAGTVHFLRVFDAWGEEKVSRLRAAGNEVVVLDEGSQKDVSGAEVRHRLRAAENWRALVPPTTAEVIDGLSEERARDLRRVA